LHKFPSFNDIINSKGNRNLGGKLVRPAIPCRVRFWPVTGEMLPTPGLDPGCQLQEGSILLKFLLETGWKMSILKLWLAF